MIEISKNNCSVERNTRHINIEFFFLKCVYVPCNLREDVKSYNNCLQPKMQYFGTYVLYDPMDALFYVTELVQKKKYPIYLLAAEYEAAGNEY